MEDREFTLFETPYTLQFIDKPIEVKDDFVVLGECDFNKRTVTVSTKDRYGNVIPDNIIQKNLMHELAHLILGEGQYLSCNDDEPLVEWIGRCLLHLRNQKII